MSMLIGADVLKDRVIYHTGIVSRSLLAHGFCLWSVNLFPYTSLFLLERKHKLGV